MSTPHRMDARRPYQNSTDRIHGHSDIGMVDDQYETIGTHHAISWVVSGFLFDRN
jgi:hypothetical protein